jgi:hypothetical protein
MEMQNKMYMPTIVKMAEAHLIVHLHLQSWRVCALQIIKLNSDSFWQ